MQRFIIQCRLLVTEAPYTLGYADTPAEAVKKARDFTKQGKRDVRIGDNEAQKHFDTETFAVQYGVR